MKVGVLGTGTVGRVIGGRFADLGHEVTIGTRDVHMYLALWLRLWGAPGTGTFNIFVAR